MTSLDEAIRALEKKWRDESNLRQESADKMENDDPQYASWHFGISDGLDKCADELAAILSARQEVAPVADEYGWVDGAPHRILSMDDGEWFIAETTYGARVVLKGLPEEWAYDFTTADGTYIKRDKIKRWRQFPDSEYKPLGESSPAHTSEARDAQGEAAISVMLADGWEWNGQAWCREPSCEIGDADRYAWLKSKLLWADLEPDDYVGLTFALPSGSHVSTNLDATLDAAMRQEAAHD